MRLTTEAVIKPLILADCKGWRLFVVEGTKALIVLTPFLERDTWFDNLYDIGSC